MCINNLFSIAQGHKQWLAEVQFLAVFEHPNLVKLLGFCAKDSERGIERLLVYEFMPNKSLEDHMFSKAYPPLPWSLRVQIALGVAEGLAYLHHGEVQVCPFLSVLRNGIVVVEVCVVW